MGPNSRTVLVCFRGFCFYVWMRAFGERTPRGFWGFWGRCFRVRSFSLFLLLFPPFSSWDRLGSVFFFLPCACLQDTDAWGRQVSAATACCAFFLSPSVCPGRSPSPLPFSFSFFLSFSLSLFLFLLHARRLTQTYPQYCWQFHDWLGRPSPEPLLQRGASPTALGGEDSGDALVAFLLCLIGIGASQPYSRGEFLGML